MERASKWEQVSFLEEMQHALEDIVAAAFLASSASLTFAQTTPHLHRKTTPPAAGEKAPPPHKGPNAPGGPGMMRNSSDMVRTGFDMRMGKDSGLKVDCGDMALADCISAAQPLTDHMAKMPPPPAGAPASPPKN